MIGSDAPPVSGGQVQRIQSGAAGLTPVSGATPPYTAPGGWLSGLVMPVAQPSDTTTAIQTVADAYLAALGSQPANAGATVVVPTPPIDGGSGMNVKTIVLIAALAAAAWFLYKKFGPSASSDA